MRDLLLSIEGSLVILARVRPPRRLGCVGDGSTAGSPAVCLRSGSALSSVIRSSLSVKQQRRGFADAAKSFLNSIWDMRLENPGNAEERDGSAYGQQANKVENEIELCPCINAAVGLGLVVVLLGIANEVTISGNNSCGGEENELSRKTQNPDCEVNDIGTLAPVEQRKQDIEVEESRSHEMDLIKNKVSGFWGRRGVKARS